MSQSPEMTEKNKIMMMLVRIGDENVEKIDSHIEKLCSYLCNMIDELGVYITDTFISCVCNIPNKPFVYAHIIHRMAEDKPEVVAGMVNEVFNQMVAKINKGDNVNPIIKFLAALADCGYLNIDTFSVFLKSLLDLHSKAFNEANDNDYFLNLALIGYLYGRRVIRENVEEGKRPEIETILENHINARPKNTDEYNVFKSVEFESAINLLWSAITYSYKDNVLLEEKIYGLYIKPSKTYSETLNSLPEITISGKLPYYRSPSYFELFAERCMENSDKGTYVIARDLLRDTLLAYQDNPYFACQKLTSMTSIPMLPYLIFDVIFDEVLRFPTPTKKTIYYSSICVTMVKEFTKEDEFEFGPVVGEALQSIFSTGDDVSNNTQQANR